MIELTQTEVDACADAEVTYPHRREYLALGRRYDALWEHSRTSDMRGRREIANLCLRMSKIGAARGDCYRVAMWRRRAYLHLCGDEEKVYRATDALKWEQAMRRVLEGDTLPAGRRRILGALLASGSTGIPGQGVAMLTASREVAREGAA